MVKSHPVRLKVNQYKEFNYVKNHFVKEVKSNPVRIQLGTMSSSREFS